MGSRLAFVLNLDAELELADPQGYAPSRRMRAEVDRLARVLLPTLAAEADEVVVLREGAVPAIDRPESFTGRAWCPTPRALELLRSAGVALPPAPPLAVLQRVNHRAFCAELGDELPGARFVETMAELDRVLAGGSPTGVLVLKRPFGFSGRGRKVVPAGPLVGAARVWAEASMAGYGKGLQVEPFFGNDLRQDFALHGLIDADGAFRLGRPTVLACDDDGRFVGSRIAEGGELADQERPALLDRGAEVAAALARAGYFGPFGIDAFRWSAEDGSRGFRSLGEINARYTMGWWVGMRPAG